MVILDSEFKLLNITSSSYAGTSHCFRRGLFLFIELQHRINDIVTLNKQKRGGWVIIINITLESVLQKNLRMRFIVSILNC